MLTVETIGRTRREHFLKAKTTKKIAQDLKVSQIRCARVLRSEETSFEYEREVQPRPKLGRWTSELDELLTNMRRRVSASRCPRDRAGTFDPELIAKNQRRFPGVRRKDHLDVCAWHDGA